MTSRLYEMQEAVEAAIESALPEGIQVLSRRKGKIANDIAAALAKIGIAVVVEPPLPTKFSDAYHLIYEEVQLEIGIIENVALQKTDETAYSLLERICEKLHQERINNRILTLESVRDESPTDKPVITFVLTIKTSI